jgi:hypothetical protein
LNFSLIVQRTRPEGVPITTLLYYTVYYSMGTGYTHKGKPPPPPVLCLPVLQSTPIWSSTVDPYIPTLIRTMTGSAFIEEGNNRLVHRTESPIFVFPEMKLCCLVPNSYIHVSVRDLYITRVGRRYINVEIRRQNIIILF